MSKSKAKRIRMVDVGQGTPTFVRGIQQWADGMGQMLGLEQLGPDHPPVRLIQGEPAEGPVEDAIRLLIAYLGEDPDRADLLETPRRVLAAYDEMTSGSRVDVAKLLSVTFDGADYDQMVLVCGIQVTSLCEHHLLPFTGVASVGYVPDGNRVVGLSKIPRLVDAYARRFQTQERLTEQIANALDSYLIPRGVGVLIRAHHACMGVRGIRQPNATMTTSALRGVMLSKPEARAEFLDLAKAGLG